MKREHRLPFEMAAREDPNAMAFYALAIAQDLEEPHRSLLLSLSDLEPHGQDPELGASYAQLEEIFNTLSFDEHEYRVMLRDISE